MAHQEGSWMQCVQCNTLDTISHCGGPCGELLYCSQRCADAHFDEHILECSRAIGVGITPGNDAARYATQLVEQGWVTIPLYTTQAEKDAIWNSFEATLNAMPEYRVDPATGRIAFFKKQRLYVKGGFGALANPSSYHNPWVLRRRMDAMRVVAPVMGVLRGLEAEAFQAPSKSRERKLEQIPDRMRVLTRRAKVQAEAWHQDLTPAKYQEAGDSIFGGWINVGKSPQYFSAFPGSHLVDPITRKTYVQLKREQREQSTAKKTKTADGFATKTKEEVATLNRLKANVIDAHGKDATRNPDGSGGWLIEVPVGHILVFYQEMVHEVAGGGRVRQEPEYRLFTAFRLTMSDRRFMSNVTPNFFTRFTVPLLKSGQKPAMYPDTGNWRGPVTATKNLEVWSKAIWKPELLTTRTKGPTARSDPNVTYTVVPKYMYSLLEVALKLQAHSLLEDYNAGGLTKDERVRLNDPETRDVLRLIAEEDPDKWEGVYMDDPKWLEEYALSRYGGRSVLSRNPYRPADVAILMPNTEWIVGFDQTIRF